MKSTNPASDAKLAKAAAQLTASLKAEADAERAGHMATYMRDQFAFLGVQTPKRRELTREFIRVAKRAEGVAWGIVEDWWARPEREFQYAAVDYLTAVQSRLVADDVPRLKQLAQTKSWWDTIDGLDRVIGQIAQRHPEVNQVLLDWSRDQDFWLRRIAIDHQRSLKDLTDTALLEAILVNNLDQSEFFINKAIGWALRAYSKTDPAWVTEFIARYGPRMAGLSIREASKYL